MHKLSSFINKKVSQQKLLIEESFLRRFNFALNDDKNDLNPSMLASFGDFIKAQKMLGLNPGQVLISKISVVQTESIKINDKIQITTVISDIFEQQGSNNPIGFLFVSVLGHKNTKILFVSERVFCVRGGFPRGKK